MKPFLYRVSTAAMLLAFVAVPAQADDESWPPPSKKKTFLESVFGTKAERRQRKAEWQKKRKASNWWEDDDSLIIFGNGNEKYRNSSDNDYVDYGDPEPIPGLGFGNVAFVLPKLQAVRDTGNQTPPPAAIDANSIRLVLGDAETPIKAAEAVRNAVVGHYTSTAYKPLWLQNGKLSPRGEELLQVLASSAEEGLEPGRYLPPGITSFDNVGSQIDGSALAAAQLDVGLTVAAVTYARHLSGGAFEPEKLSLYYDIKPEPISEPTAVRILAYTPFPKAFLAGLVPKHPAYAALKAVLAKLRSENTSVTETPFPEGKRTKIGQKDVRIPELRGRLIRLGYLDETYVVAADAIPEVLDKNLGKALKAYQAAQAIPQTSALDQATVKAFNTNQSTSNIEKLVINMERVRWLPKDLGSKHVFVNQASYEVRVMAKGVPVWASKVIVGRPTTQTNVFSDVMENVVFNPTWGMPQSIIINEYAGKLRRDPGYFDRIGYKVTNANGKRVSSRSVNWSSNAAIRGIGVQQPAGDGNALGELKFNFPNAHSIYMHDTPNRELFDESRRNFSHGCVRVQNPREFAAVLLGLGQDEIGAKIAAGATVTQKLNESVEVHLTYFTAWPDDSGNIRFYSDPYQRDATLARAVGVVAKAFATETSVKIVEAAGAPVIQTAD